MITPLVSIGNRRFRGFAGNARLRSPGTSSNKESSDMPTTKEFSIDIEDEPGTLAEVCRALADARVNILAFQSIPGDEKSLVRFVVDNPTSAKSVLNSQKLRYTEAEVAQVILPHRPG